MSVLDYVFLGCATFGGGMFLIRVVLFFIGFGGDTDVDVDADVDVDLHVDLDADAGHLDLDHGDVHGGDVHADAHTGADASFRLLSFFSLTAFFMMFGLVGLTLRREASMSEAYSIVGAGAGGLFALYIIARLIGFMKGLQSVGTMRVGTAIGQEGSVYLTIHAGSVGKVQAVIDGRLRHMNARAEGGEELKTGERVLVVNVEPDNTLVVERMPPGE